jgi:hypothetical protein
VPPQVTITPLLVAEEPRGRVRALEPKLVWLAHEREAWRSRLVEAAFLRLAAVIAAEV